MSNMSLRQFLKRNFRNRIIIKKSSSVSGNFCDDCLWFYKNYNKCTHPQHAQNPFMINERRDCDWKFDLKLGRDYDIEVVQWYKDNDSSLVNVDENGKEFI